MSYEIYFVRRDPGESFEDALDEVEASFEGDPGPLTATDLEVWEDVRLAASNVLGDVEVSEDETTRELTHPGTGIQLALFKGEMTIRVPDGDASATSLDVMSKVYELARAIERSTGLEGYDPLLLEPVTEVRDRRIAPVRRSPPPRDDDGEATGTSVTLPQARPRRELEPAGGVGGERRWWEFWKR